MTIRATRISFIAATAALVAPGVAFAQAAPYARVAANSPEACAQICGTDRVCSSWTFGGQTRAGSPGSQGAQPGLCALSASPTPRAGPGQVAGLPVRTTVPLQQSVPQATRPLAPGASLAPGGGAPVRGAWGVQPAPWLASAGPTGPGQPLVPLAPASRPPAAQLPPAAAAPVSGSGQGARIEFDQPGLPPGLPRAEGAPPLPAQATRAASMPPPQQVTPRTVPATPPAALQPVTQAAPVAPRPLPPAQPAPAPPRTTVPAAPAAPAAGTAAGTAAGGGQRPARRAGSGQPRELSPPPWRPEPPAAGRDSSAVAPAAVPATTMAAAGAPPSPVPQPQIAAAPQIDRGQPAPAGPVVPASVQPGADGMIDAAEAYRARNYARVVPGDAPTGAMGTGPAGGAAGGAAPLAAAGGPPPGVDPRAWEAARGPDGMIDAAELRRQQMRLDRERGVPAYSVQQEWSDVEASRAAQRAATGSPDNRVIPGSVPLEGGDFGQRITPEEAAAQEREDATPEGEEGAAREPARRRPGAGTPRRSRSDESAAVNPAIDPGGGSRVQMAAAVPQAGRPPIQRSGLPRRQPPAAASAGSNALDREPQLAGGPG